MKKSLIIIAVVLSIGLMASNAFSWGRGGGGRGCGAYGYGPGNYAQSNLTEEQQGKLSDLRQKFIDETYDTRSAILDKQRDLDMLLETSAPDKAKLSALIQDITALKKTMLDRRIDFVLAAKKISPELSAFSFRHLGRGFGMGPRNGARPCMGAASNVPPCAAYNPNQPAQ